MIYKIFFKLVSYFDAEKTHHMVTLVLKHMVPLSLLKWYRGRLAQSEVKLAGLTLSNRLGLAAGFDKNADFFQSMLGLGFGFVECGTVTPLAQPGNNKPRLFRVTSQEALINRMGFNNKGVDYLVEQLKKPRAIDAVVGVNVGKNKITPIEDAYQDYAICIDKVYLYADYISLNLSSPNTENLRKLQEASYLETLLTQLSAQRSQLQNKTQKSKPYFLKISVDLSLSEVYQLLDLAIAYQIDGIISSNTTIDPMTVNSIELKEKGGISGQPLFERSLKRMQEMVAYDQDKKLVFIGVGGIDSQERALKMIESGASAIQLYTGFIYQGPGLIKKLAAAIP